MRGRRQEVSPANKQGSGVPAIEAPRGREDKAGGRTWGQRRVREQVAGRPVGAQGACAGGKCALGITTLY